MSPGQTFRATLGDGTLVAQMKKKVSGGGKQKDLGKEMGKGSPLSIGAMLAKL